MNINANTTPKKAAIFLLERFTQPELAKMTETTQPTISRIASGETNPNWRIGWALVYLAMKLKTEL